MAVRIEDGMIYLEGDCGVEDAEALASALADATFARVDLRLCRELHGAVVQALLVLQPPIEGQPANEFLNRFVLPVLMRPADQPSAAVQNFLWN
jgi:hypothetical protein